ncbi:MAG: peptidoglycan DD-metalloendopeptidase family protein [Tannerellaceae bacterium]|nr:peptidoglycan DD-metalloendopeptidase family protein [Tannerellaceae bacterium]
MNRIYILAVAGLLMLALSCKRTQQAPAEEETVVAPDTLGGISFLYGICIDSLDTNEYVIGNGDNMGAILGRLGFTALETDSIVRSSREVLDPAKLQAGRSYTVFTSRGSVPAIRYVAFGKTLTDFAVIDFTGDTLSSYSYEKPIAFQRRYMEGSLNTSLWNYLHSRGEDPLLALRIADIYAWQIDFFDVKDGDSFRVLYDVAFIDDTTALEIASIQGAVFTHRGKDFTAVPFTQDSIFEYFDEEGNSLRKEFLKAPLDFFRISSRFSNSRFHPVLKRYRAHHGVDYAAPAGTPVKSIGVGVVTGKGFQAGGGGNFLKIKHNSVYTTTYMHLSRFAQGIQVGKSVQQGEVIGYVGSTGLSTGPHLDFRVHKNGQPVDPQKMESPPSKPVRPELMDSFATAKQSVFAELDSLRVTYKAAPPSTSIE